MATIPSLPAISQSQCSGWNPQQINLYNALPQWMINREVAFRKKYGSFKRILGSIDWEPNKGPTMTGVVAEPPPTLRQFAFPAALASACAKKDIIQYRERTYTFSLRHHKFESPVFQWLSSFNDFVAKKLTKNLDFVMRWQEDFTAQFYRGFIFHQSPAIMFADHATMVVDDQAPAGDGNDAGTDGKSNAYLQARIANLGAPGNLTIKTLFQALNYLEEDGKAVPYQSGSLKDDSFLNDKFLLLTSSEAYNNFINDPFLKEMKNCDLDVVQEGFKGSILGRITTALHSNPLRFLVDEDGAVSWPAPETIQENPAASNFGQTVVGCDFKNTQYEVAFLCGMQGYSIVNVGPPPSDFASSGPDKIGRLRWNGRPIITDRINVPCTTDAETTFYEPNAYDEFLKIISLVVMGIAPEVPRNVLPIVFKRSRTITQSLI